jgi:pyridoxamine 5'-phosphate oxidase
MPEPPVPLEDLRRDYQSASLDERSVDHDPHRQFAQWFHAAVAANVPEPNAMTLATVDDRGRPAARIVLLKDHDARGFTFYSNFESRKGRELTTQPYAALVFFWVGLERQVRIEGAVEQVDAATADAYFRKRPRLSRISAWASPQSTPVPDRAMLEARFDEAQRRFPGDEVARPPHWGGYRVVPDRFEFWQGRASRLHDRIEYRRDDTGWSFRRLAP